MNESLLRILGLIEGRLAPRARPSFLGLLPADHVEAVDAFAKRTKADEDVRSALEERLLAQFDAPSQDEEEDETEGLEGESQGDAEEEASAPNEEESGLPTLLALLLVVAAPETAADFLIHLPPHLQGRIALKMATGTLLNITRDLSVAEVELIEALRQVLTNKEEWGVETSCRILRAIPEDRQLRRIITAADELEHETVALIQNHLFVFEDLMRLSDPDLQVLLMQMDNATLAEALQMTEEKVESRLLRNVSSRRRGVIVEEVERYARATLEEIELAQLQVLNAARQFYEQGKISTYFGSVDRKKRLTLVVEDEEDLAAEGEEEREPEKRKRALLPLGIVLAGFVLTVAWFLLGDGTVPSRSVSPSVSQKKVKRAQAGEGRSTRVAVQEEEETSSGEKGGRASVSRQAELKPGESMKTPDGVRALLELPGFARFELDESAEVERPSEDDSEEAGELFLRVGRVRTAILEEGFVIRTPVVEVKGKPGTVFRTRVVLNATTTVEVERGNVEVISLVEDGKRWLLQGGERGRFASEGGETIEPLED